MFLSPGIINEEQFFIAGLIQVYKTQLSSKLLFFFIFAVIWSFTQTFCSKTSKFKLNVVQLVVVKPFFTQRCVSVCHLIRTSAVYIRLPMITFPVDWSRLEASVWLVGGSRKYWIRSSWVSVGSHRFHARPRLLMSYFLCNVKSRLNTFSHWYSWSFILLARH